MSIIATPSISVEAWEEPGAPPTPEGGSLWTWTKPQPPRQAQDTDLLVVRSQTLARTLDAARH